MAFKETPVLDKLLWVEPPLAFVVWFVWKCRGSGLAQALLEALHTHTQ